nr:hypothetical protein [Tanacetum cinerariifolium]
MGLQVWKHSLSHLISGEGTKLGKGGDMGQGSKLGEGTDMGHVMIEEHSHVSNKEAVCDINGDSEEDNTDREGEDSDFVVDEDPMMNKVRVDMKEFLSNIDKGLNRVSQVRGIWRKEKKEVCEDVIKSWNKCVVLKREAYDINAWHNPNKKEDAMRSS